MCPQRLDIPVTTVHFSALNAISRISPLPLVYRALAATQQVPQHIRLHSRGSTRVPPTSGGVPFLPPSSRGGILSLRGRERIPGITVVSQEEALCTGKARETPGSCHHSQSHPDVSVHSRETCFPCNASTFKPRTDSHHGGTWDSTVGKARGKASLERLVGKPLGKGTDPLIHVKGSVSLLLELGRKAHVHTLSKNKFLAPSFPKLSPQLTGSFIRCCLPLHC